MFFPHRQQRSKEAIWPDEWVTRLPQRMLLQSRKTKKNLLNRRSFNQTFRWILAKVCVEFIYTRHPWRCGVVGRLHSPQSHSSLCSCGFVQLPPTRILNDFGYISVILEDAGLLAAFTHHSHIVHYAPVASFSCRLHSPHSNSSLYSCGLIHSSRFYPGHSESSMILGIVTLDQQFAFCWMRSIDATGAFTLCSGSAIMP